MQGLRGNAVYIALFRQPAMSKPSTSRRLGSLLRQLRGERGLALRHVAAGADMDPAVLSKIELGARLPTPRQTAALAAFFDISPTQLEARRMAEKFWKDNQTNPAAPAAAVLIRESAAVYRVNKSVNKKARSFASKSKPSGPSSACS